MTESRSMPRVSDAELERRWSAVRAAMAEARVEVLVVGGSNDWAGGYFRWFTGQQVGSGNPRTVLFPRDEPMTLVEHGPAGIRNDMNPAHADNPGIGLRLTTPSHLFSVSYTAGQDAALVAGEVRRKGWRTLGLVGSAGMYHGFCAPLLQELAGLEVSDMTDAVDRIKAIKSAEEIALIRQATAMQDRIVDALRSFIRPGLRDFEVAAHAEYLGHQFGSDQGIFLGCSAKATEPVTFHTRSRQGRRLEAGDALMLLIENNGPGGYYGEIVRFFVLGKASTQLSDAFGLALEAQRNTLKLLRPGATGAQVLEAHNEYMRSRGLPEERRVHVHGQGYDLVERPLMRPEESIALAPGMNLACHPAAVKGGVYAIIDDNYLIAENGQPQPLHRSPQELYQL